jgi:hypothetical protein
LPRWPGIVRISRQLPRAGLTATLRRQLPEAVTPTHIRPLRPAGEAARRHLWSDDLAFYETAVGEEVYSAADAAGALAVYRLTQEFNHSARQPCGRLGRVTPSIRYNRPP